MDMQTTDWLTGKEFRERERDRRTHPSAFHVQVFLINKPLDR